MKKFLALVLLFLVPTNVYSASYVDKQLKEAKKNAKYNTVDKRLNRSNYTKNFTSAVNVNEIKDPQLIKLTDMVPVADAKYQEKMAKDTKVYENTIKPTLAKKTNTVNIEPSAIDFYKVYRIAERIIRANNLEYTNWRFAIRKTPEEFNASSYDSNLVVINTALYDSLYTNDDALAFVIAHEIAHNLLGHQQRTAEISRILHALERGASAKTYYTNNPGPALAKLALTSGAAAYSVKYYKELRMMEYMADTEGLSLIIKAGYNPEKALYAIDFMKTLTDLDKLVTRTHPMAADRLKSAQENIYYANPKWIEDGKYNIYNSNVLPCKKSSDHVSIIISKDDNIAQHYTPETIEQKLTRLAYVSYTKGDMKNAVKYFEKLTEISNDYAPYLYLSYAYEYLYSATNDKAYLNKSKEAAKKSYSLNSTNTYVKEQITQISNL